MALSKTSIHQYRINFTPSYAEGDNAATAHAISDAYHREFYAMHTIQIVNGGACTIDVQISLVEEPDELLSSTDWATIYQTTAQAEAFMPSVQLFRWIRFVVYPSGDGTTPSMHILSAIRANS